MSKTQVFVTAMVALLALSVLTPDAAAQAKIDPLTGALVGSDPPPRPVDPDRVERADLSGVNALLKTSAYEEAEAMLAGLQENHPDDGRLLLLRGEVLIALKKMTEALPILERAAELEPDRPRLNFQLATARQAAGDTEGAMAAYAREAELSDDTRVKVMSLLNRSLLLEKARNWTEAAADVERVLEIEPDRKTLYGDLAGLHLRAGEFTAAAETLDRGREAGFRSARLDYNVGARLFNDGEFEAAARSFRNALTIDPDLADAERSLGSTLERLEQPTEAAQHFRRYLELRPEAKDAQAIKDRIAAAGGG